MGNSKFPGQIDTEEEIPYTFSLENVVESANCIRDAVFEIEKTLGVDPQGSKDSVADRLAVLLTEDGYLQASLIQDLSLIPANGTIENVHVSLTAGIVESKLSLNVGTSVLQSGINLQSERLDILEPFATGIHSQLNRHIVGDTSDSASFPNKLHPASDVIFTANTNPNSLGLVDDPPANNSFPPGPALHDQNYTVQEAIELIIGSAYVPGDDQSLKEHIDFINATGLDNMAHPANAIYFDDSNSQTVVAENVQQAIEQLDKLENEQITRHRDHAHANGILSDATTSVSRNPFVLDGYHGFQVFPVPASVNEVIDLEDSVLTGEIDEDINNQHKVLDIRLNGSPTTLLTDGLIRQGDVLTILANGVERKFIIDELTSETSLRFFGLNIEDTFTPPGNVAKLRITRTRESMANCSALAVARYPLESSSVAPRILKIGNPDAATVTTIGFEQIEKIDATKQNIKITAGVGGGQTRTISIDVYDTGDDDNGKDVDRLDSVIRNINTNCAAKFIPVAAYRIKNELTVSHNLAGGEFTLKISEGDTLDASEAMGFQHPEVPFNIDVRGNYGKSYIVNGKELYGLPLLHTEEVTLDGTENVALTAFIRKTKVAKGSLVHLINHSSDVNSNGTYLVYDTDPNAITLNTSPGPVPPSTHPAIGTATLIFLQDSISTRRFFEPGAGKHLLEVFINEFGESLSNKRLSYQPTLGSINQNGVIIYGINEKYPVGSDTVLRVEQNGGAGSSIFFIQAAGLDGTKVTVDTSGSEPKTFKVFHPNNIDHIDVRIIDPINLNVNVAGADIGLFATTPVNKDENMLLSTVFFDSGSSELFMPIDKRFFGNLAKSNLRTDLVDSIDNVFDETRGDGVVLDQVKYSIDDIAPFFPNGGFGEGAFDIIGHEASPTIDIRGGIAYINGKRIEVNTAKDFVVIPGGLLPGNQEFILVVNENGFFESIPEVTRSYADLYNDSSVAILYRFVTTDAATVDTSLTRDVRLDVRNLDKKVLEKQPFITVGDGINSFGDFNGDNGIVQAANYLDRLQYGSTTDEKQSARTIYIKPGIYSPTAPITLNDGASLLGDSEFGVTINAPEASSLITINSDDVTIKNLNLVGNAAATTTLISMINVASGGNNISIENVSIGPDVANTSCVSIRATGLTVTDMTLSNCTIKSFGSSRAVDLGTAANLVVKDTEIESVDGQGLFVSASCEKLDINNSTITSDVDALSVSVNLSKSSITNSTLTSESGSAIRVGQNLTSCSIKTTTIQSTDTFPALKVVNEINSSKFDDVTVTSSTNVAFESAALKKSNLLNVTAQTTSGSYCFNISGNVEDSAITNLTLPVGATIASINAGSILDSKIDNASITTAGSGICINSPTINDVNIAGSTLISDAKTIVSSNVDNLDINRTSITSNNNVAFESSSVNGLSIDRCTMTSDIATISITGSEFERLFVIDSTMSASNASGGKCISATALNDVADNSVKSFIKDTKMTSGDICIDVGSISNLKLDKVTVISVNACINSTNATETYIYNSDLTSSAGSCVALTTSSSVSIIDSNLDGTTLPTVSVSDIIKMSIKGTEIFSNTAPCIREIASTTAGKLNISDSVLSVSNGAISANSCVHLPFNTGSTTTVLKVAGSTLSGGFYSINADNNPGGFDIVRNNILEPIFLKNATNSRVSDNNVSASAGKSAALEFFGDVSKIKILNNTMNGLVGALDGILFRGSAGNECTILSCEVTGNFIDSSGGDVAGTSLSAISIKNVSSVIGLSISRNKINEDLIGFCDSGIRFINDDVGISTSDYSGIKFVENNISNCRSWGITVDDIASSPITTSKLNISKNNIYTNTGNTLFGGINLDFEGAGVTSISENNISASNVNAGKDAIRTSFPLAPTNMSINKNIVANMTKGDGNFVNSFGSGGDGVDISNNYVSDCLFTRAINYTNVTLDNININSNTFDAVTCTDNTIHIDGTGTTSATIKIENNIVDGTFAKNAVYIESCDNAYIKNNNISVSTENCIFLNFVKNGDISGNFAESLSYSAIKIVPSGNLSTSEKESFNVHKNSLVFKSSATGNAHGIIIDGLTAPASPGKINQLNIEGNTIRQNNGTSISSASYGVQIANIDGETAKISNNNIDCLVHGGTNGSRGVSIHNVNCDLKIDGNSIKSSGVSLSFVNNIYPAKTVSITSNDIYTSGNECVKAKNSENNSFKTLQFSDNIISQDGGSGVCVNFSGYSNPGKVALASDQFMFSNNTINCSSLTSAVSAVGVNTTNNIVCIGNKINAGDGIGINIGAISDVSLDVSGSALLSNNDIVAGQHSMLFGSGFNCSETTIVGNTLRSSNNAALYFLYNEDNAGENIDTINIEGNTISNSSRGIALDFGDFANIGTTQYNDIWEKSQKILSIKDNDISTSGNGISLDAVFNATTTSYLKTNISGNNVNVTSNARGISIKNGYTSGGTDPKLIIVGSITGNTLKVDGTSFAFGAEIYKYSGTGKFMGLTISGNTFWVSAANLNDNATDSCLALNGDGHTITGNTFMSGSVPAQGTARSCSSIASGATYSFIDGNNMILSGGNMANDVTDTVGVNKGSFIERTITLPATSWMWEDIGISSGGRPDIGSSSMDRTESEMSVYLPLDISSYTTTSYTVELIKAETVFYLLWDVPVASGGINTASFTLREKQYGVADTLVAGTNGSAVVLGGDTSSQFDLTLDSVTGSGTPWEMDSQKTYVFKIQTGIVSDTPNGHTATAIKITYRVHY